MSNAPIRTQAVGERELLTSPIRLCLDHDNECPDVKCKVTCWLHQPERGYCPYLKDAAAIAQQAEMPNA